MDIFESLQQTLTIDPGFQDQLLSFLIRLGWFVGFTLLTLLVGRFLPVWLQWGINHFFPKAIGDFYSQVVVPLRDLLVRSLILGIMAVNINWFQPYSGLHEFLRLIVYLPLTITVAWFLSRLMRQVIRVYGVKLIQSSNRDIDDFLLIGESVANVVIGFLAVIFFAQTQSVNLMSILTGVGIGGVAVAFAAKEVLSQVVGTVLIYLDRPYVPGEYIRANFNPRSNDIYGRIESIGIRSTKIRLAAKNTLLIAPNSLMARMDVENVSRGRKVMVLFYLDFAKILNDWENALVYKVIEESLHKELSDVDSDATQIVLFEREEQLGTRARVSLFVKGATDKSIMIRTRLLEIANQSITERLGAENLQFEFAEPTIYVDSPMTL
jgi:MscS family membrane protein